MNTEQLQMILEALNGAGAGAKDVAIWYLIAPLFEAIVIASAMLAGIWIITRSVLKAYTISESLDAKQRGWVEICKHAKVNSYVWNKKEVELSTHKIIQKLDKV